MKESSDATVPKPRDGRRKRVSGADRKQWGGDRRGCARGRERPPSAGGGRTGGLPSSFHWSDQGVILSPKTAPGHDIVSVKDPTIVRYHGQYLVYATTADTSGNWSVEYTHFTSFSQAARARQYYLSDNPDIGSGYRAAPQLFY